MFQGWLDVREVVEMVGVVLTYTGLDVLLTGVGYHGDDRTCEYDTSVDVLLAGVEYQVDDRTSEYDNSVDADELLTRVEDQLDVDDSTSFTTVLTPEYDTGITELPTVLEPHLDVDASTSFPPVSATGPEDKTPPSFLCIPSTKGSALPSLAGACFNQHLP